MNTLNNTKIIFNTAYVLFLLAILALGVVIMPLKTNAQVNTSSQGVGFAQDSRGFTYFRGYAQNNNQNYYQTPSTPTQTVYSNTNNGPAVTTAPKIVVKAQTATNTAKTTKVVTANESGDSPSDLTANAVFGSDSLLPSGIIQWVLVAILVLSAVILVRKIYGGGEKYNAIPMKHN